VQVADLIGQHRTRLGKRPPAPPSPERPDKSPRIHDRDNDNEPPTPTPNPEVEFFYDPTTNAEIDNRAQVREQVPLILPRVKLTCFSVGVQVRYIVGKMQQYVPLAPGPVRHVVSQLKRHREEQAKALGEKVAAIQAALPSIGQQLQAARADATREREWEEGRTEAVRLLEKTGVHEVGSRASLDIKISFVQSAEHVPFAVAGLGRRRREDSRSWLRRRRGTWQSSLIGRIRSCRRLGRLPETWSYKRVASVRTADTQISASSSRRQGRICRPCRPCRPCSSSREQIVDRVISAGGPEGCPVAT
jgi:hypothetical protein